MRHSINKELQFGQCAPTAPDEEIKLPNPILCNLKLAIMRVLFASGAAEVLEQLWRDYEDVDLVPSGLGFSQELDNLFLNKLALISAF